MKPAIVAALGLSLLLGGCATPSGKTPYFDLERYSVPEVPVMLITAIGKETSPPRTDVFHRDATLPWPFDFDNKTRTITVKNPIVVWDSCDSNGFVIVREERESSVRSATLQNVLYQHGNAYVEVEVAGVKHHVRTYEDSSEFGFGTDSLSDSYFATPTRSLDFKLRATLDELAPSRSGDGGGYSLVPVNYTFQLHIENLGKWKIKTDDYFLEPDNIKHYFENERPRPITATCTSFG